MFEHIVFENHLSLAQANLADYIAECMRIGIETHPALKVEFTGRLHAYYDPNAISVYINFLSTSDPLWKLKTQGLMALLSFEIAEEFIDYWLLQIRYIVAHELGHHLRDYHHRANWENSWLEEQIANRFASALIKEQFTDSEKQRFCGYLQRAFEGLAPKIEAHNDALSAYGHIHYALHSLGLIDDDLLNSALQIDSDPGEWIAAKVTQPEVIDVLARRADLIARFNQEYISNPVRYLYYHLAWTYYELTSLERFDLAQLKQQYLD